MSTGAAKKVKMHGRAAEWWAKPKSKLFEIGLLTFLCLSKKRRISL